MVKVDKCFDMKLFSCFLIIDLYGFAFSYSFRYLKHICLTKVLLVLVVVKQH